jgi:hypothetical protein
MLSEMTTVSDCIGYAYQDYGHTFLVWNFPTEDVTLVFDLAVGEPRLAWHQRAYWTSATSTWERHRGQHHMYAFGMHLVGDHTNGRVYEMSMEYHDDNGNPKRWIRAFPLPTADNKYVFPANFEVMAETGETTATPSMMMRYSKDGGYTFGNEKTSSVGALGQYSFRCRFPGNLGQARKPYIELSGSDAFRVTLTGGLIDIAAGTA